MPFKSAKQRAYMMANLPEIAKKWTEESKRFNKVVKKPERLGPIYVKRPIKKPPTQKLDMREKKKRTYKKVLDAKVSKKNNKTTKDEGSGIHIKPSKVGSFTAW